MIDRLGFPVVIILTGIAFFWCYKYIWTTAKLKNRNAWAWIILATICPILIFLVALILTKLPALPQYLKPIKPFTKEIK